MLHEISRRSIHINKNEEAYISWHNNHILTVRTDKSIQLYDYSYNLQCPDKNIDFVVSLIPNNKSSPATGLFPDNFLKRGLSNLELTQMIIDPGLWPYNPQLTNEMANIVAFEWSPQGIIYNNQCILAILNNVGNIELFGPQSHKWTSALDLSGVIKAKYLCRQDRNAVLKNFQEVKAAVDAVETCAMCWGPKESNCIYFVTAQRNGVILIWLLQCASVILAEQKGQIHADIGEIMSIMWIPTTENMFLLICSNVMGQIFSLRCKIIKKEVQLIKKQCLWRHEDRMIAKYLHYSVLDDKMLLLYNKHRHLVVQIIDQNCEILSQIVKNVNDYRITDIKYCKDTFYLTTVNCKMYKIDLETLNDALDVNISLIGTKDQYSTYELYSFSFSTNKVMLALAMIDRKIMCRKSPEKLDIIILTSQSDDQVQPEMSLLLNNPTKKFTRYWDCIELLRYKTMKLKTLPSLDYVQLYCDGDVDFYKLKIYLILLTFYKYLDKIIKNQSKGVLPETSMEVIKDKILASHACSLTTELYNSCQNSEKTLSEFELQSFVAAKKFLELYCQKYKRHLNAFLEPNVLNFTNLEITNTCQCCDEIVEGFTCKKGHLNMFCSITFTLIENDDYLLCKSCGNVARTELQDSDVMCIFCDLYMNSCYLPS